MKLIKRLLVLIVVLALIIVVLAIMIRRSITVEVTDADLPQNVYSETGDLLTIAEMNLVGLILANENDRYTMIEEFMNYVLLDSIRTNINDSYDPLGDIETDAANYVMNEGVFYIDYVYAELNDSNQMVICISFGTNQYYKIHSAIYLTFDIDIDIDIELLNINVIMTLFEYKIADKELSMMILDFLFNKLDKSSIEDSMTFGVLDLDDYTFTISLIN